MPEMHFVDSSNIEAIGYDADNMALYVQFLKTGETYVYENVEEWKFDEMLQADSKGRYLNAEIKPAHSFYKL